MMFLPEYVDMIRDGRKTQTRRISRGRYKVGKDYAIQLGKGKKTVDDMRIVIDAVWTEFQVPRASISAEDAKAEGGHTPDEFEKGFKELNPAWKGRKRYMFEFHAIFLDEVWKIKEV